LKQLKLHKLTVCFFEEVYLKHNTAFNLEAVQAPSESELKKKAKFW